MVRVHVRPLESSESDFGAFFVSCVARRFAAFFAARLSGLFRLLAPQDFRRFERFKN